MKFATFTYNRHFQSYLKDSFVKVGQWSPLRTLVDHVDWFDEIDFAEKLFD